MSPSSKALSLVAIASSLTLAACTNDAANGTGDNPALPTLGNGGQASAYPSGPYGVKPGSVIANYRFQGFPDSTKSMAMLEPIALGDFYNPTGKDVFPKGSPYGEGNPKPKALVIDVGSVWCGPCNLEAGTVLPKLRSKYQPQGGEFLDQLVDGAVQGQPAGQKELVAWTRKYKIDYPATIDPSYQLGALFEANTFPGNAIIDTRTMKLCQVISGEPDPTDNSIGAAFWAKLDAVLADSSACN